MELRSAVANPASSTSTYRPNWGSPVHSAGVREKISPSGLIDVRTIHANGATAKTATIPAARYRAAVAPGRRFTAPLRTGVPLPGYGGNGTPEGGARQRSSGGHLVAGEAAVAHGHDHEDGEEGDG